MDIDKIRGIKRPITIEQIQKLYKMLGEMQITLEAEADIYIKDGVTESFRENVYNLMKQLLELL